MSNELGDLLGAHEGGYHDPYNTSYDGSKLGRHHDFSNLTIAEILLQQERRIADNYDHRYYPNLNHLHAVGKYQIMQPTLNELIIKHGLDPQLKFTPETQENIFADYLLGKEKPRIKQYIEGRHGVTLDQARRAVADEWLSVEEPGGKPGFNRKGQEVDIHLRDVDQALNTMRAEYQQAIHNGSTPENAWREVTGRTPVQGKTIDPPTHPGPTALLPSGPSAALDLSSGEKLGAFLDQMIAASQAGDQAAFRQMTQMLANTPETQAFHAQTVAIVDQMEQQAAQQQREQQVQQQGPVMHISR